MQSVWSQQWSAPFNMRLISFCNTYYIGEACQEANTRRKEPRELQLTEVHVQHFSCQVQVCA